MNNTKSRTSKTRPTVYAFIDSQNLNLGTIKFGWKMDWKHFRSFLAKKYNVSKAFMFIGYIPDNQPMYEQLHDSGYLIALKPTVEHTNPNEDNLDPDLENRTEPHIGVKGNIDADLVLFAMKYINEYDKAVIVSGDGDFASLAEYLIEQNKLLNILTPNWQYSSLLKPYEQYIDRLDLSKRLLAYNTHKKMLKK